MLPHTNIGVAARDELERLREVTASQGLMLESVNPDLVVHQGSPTSTRRVRLDCIRAAGRAADPVHDSGSWSASASRRRSAIEALAAPRGRAGRVRPHPGGDPPELRPAPALLRRGARGDRRRDAEAKGRHGRPSRADCRRGPSEITLDDMRELVRACRRLMPDVGDPDPAEPLRLVAAARRGRRDRPRRAVGQRRPHLAGAPVPVAAPDAQASLRRAGYALTERLCVYPQYMDPELDGAGRARRDQAEVLELHPAARLGPARGAADPARPRAGARSPRAATASRCPRTSSTALFAETRPEAIEDMRQAADELRAELAGETVTFVVNRNINVSNICIVGCAFCGFGQGKRSPDAYQHDEEEFERRVQEAVELRRHRDLHAVGHPSRLDARGLRAAGCGWRSRWRPQIHLHAYSPMEVHYMCERSGRCDDVFARLREAGLGSTPGTAAEVLARRRARAHLAEQAAGGALGRDHGGVGARGLATSVDRDVRPHRGALGAGRAHARRARAPGAHRRASTSSCRCRSSRSTRCSAARTASRRSRARRTSSTRPSSGSRSARRVRSLQASWVKMGLDAATEALDWGVNDLGGTLMEENISRLAGSYHGVRLEPEDLIGAAHRAGRPAAERTPSTGSGASTRWNRGGLGGAQPGASARRAPLRNHAPTQRTLAPRRLALERRGSGSAPGWSISASWRRTSARSASRARSRAERPSRMSRSSSVVVRRPPVAGRARPRRPRAGAAAAPRARRSDERARRGSRGRRRGLAVDERSAALLGADQSGALEPAVDGARRVDVDARGLRERAHAREPVPGLERPALDQRAEPSRRAVCSTAAHRFG